MKNLLISLFAALVIVASFFLVVNFVGHFVFGLEGGIFG